MGKTIGILYDVEMHTTHEHIHKIYADAKLEKEATIRNCRIVQMEGAREVSRNVLYGINWQKKLLSNNKEDYNA